ncbi:glycosyltransferase family 4 protein [Streptomyces sp. PSKA28]|uniref:Glycosyltransferase family 4 protein n=1 Tax=Streptomyces himalayensis subsp. himalayensis TaxID=2756131 RepID=A0A7W0DHG9_9ACTN|nr:glycosyltransferase family 4 protein [Streptomyces himalayensis subsp. himalayensis]
MRVLFSPDVFVRQRFGGVSRYFAELHTGLIKAGIDAQIFPGLHNNQYIARRGARTGLRQLPVGSRLLLSKAAFAAYSMTQPKACVVHPTYYTSSMLPGARPHVCTFHDLIHLRYPLYFAPSDNTVDRQRFWAARADRIIAVSEATAQDLVSMLGVPSSKITVVHHGVHIPNVATRNASGDHLLYVGGRSGYKNWRILVEALRAPELASLRLMCSGGGAPTNEEKRLLADSRLSRRVDFVQADEETLCRLYQSAVALVYPSLYEGFGLPPLEAMARGVPVIASRAASIPEVVSDAALLFSPCNLDELVDAIGRVLDTSTREELTRRGLARARMFPWSKTTQRTIDVYREVLS